jgi:hypothetical protein
MSKPVFTIIDDSILQPEEKIESSLLTQNNSAQSVRDAIADLFDSVVMTKTHQHHSFGIYKAAIETLAGTGQNYIVAIVPNDTKVNTGSSVYLKGLPWISFQTRNTDQPQQEFAGLRLRTQRSPEGVKKGSILFDKIKIASEKEEKHVYIPDHLPVIVEMILKRPDEKFAQEAFLVSAINKYQTNIIIDQGSY